MDLARAWCRDKYPQYAHNNPGGLRDIWDGCVDWHRSQEVKRFDWYQALQNAVRGRAKLDFLVAQKALAEKPQMAGKRDLDGPTDLGSEVAVVLEENK
jgi:hypothetical protein